MFKALLTVDTRAAIAAHFVTVMVTSARELWDLAQLIRPYIEFTEDDNRAALSRDLILKCLDQIIARHKYSTDVNVLLSPPPKF